MGLDVLTYLGGTAVGVVLLSQIAQHSEVLGGWAAERVWTAIEGALGGRKVPRPSLGAPVRWAGRKVGGWAKTGALIVADPFLEIARSFVPEYEALPSPSPPQGEAITPPPAPAQQRPVVPTEPKQAEVVPGSSTPTPMAAAAKAKPTEAEFKASMAELGVSPSAPQGTVARNWAKLQNSADEAAVKKAHAAWLVVCAYREVRND